MTPPTAAPADRFDHLLVAEDVACARGGQALFEGFGVRLAPGEALTVMGPNGSGKTTLLRCLAGFGEPLAGRVLCGPDGALGETGAERLLATALLGHDNGLKPALSPRETVAFWAALFEQPADPDAVLARVRLTARADLPVRVLSAGQRRRLALARLLVSARPIWILDEPATALDDTSTALLETLLAEHRARGGVVVAALHQPLRLERAKRCRLVSPEDAEAAA